jgi:hypothetical protein
MKAKINLILTVGLIALLNGSCEKSANSGYIKTEMTCVQQDTSAYQQVNVDIKQVSIHYEGSQNDSWIDLPTNSGTYDLLEIRNDITVLISDEARIPIGKVTQIRMLLGTNNSVVLGGVSYYLTVPSAYTSGVKINVDQEIQRNDYLMITLDFRADESINLSGSGNYMLKPVIKVKSVSNY